MRCFDERRSISNIMHTFGLDQRRPLGYALASAASPDTKWEGGNETGPPSEPGPRVRESESESGGGGERPQFRSSSEVRTKPPKPGFTTKHFAIDCVFPTRFSASVHQAACQFKKYSQAETMHRFQEPWGAGYIRQSEDKVH